MFPVGVQTCPTAEVIPKLEPMATQSNVIRIVVTRVFIGDLGGIVVFICLFPFQFWLFTGVLQEIGRSLTRKVGRFGKPRIETRSSPDSLAATHRGFTF